MSSPIVAWRRPARSGPSTPLVLFLHGRGADEHDLLDLADVLPRTFAYASLRGPVEAEGGWTWFESHAVARPIATSLRASIAYVRGWLDGPQSPYGRERCYVLGFSAGMMMASALVLDDPARFSGAVLLSGALPFGAGIAIEPGRLRERSIFHGHGTHDLVIPAGLVERSERYLRDQSGAELTERRYAHAHTISSREADDIAEWFEARG